LATVRLVAELDLQVDGELFQSAYEVLRQHLITNFPKRGLRVVDELSGSFPACTVVVLTALGQHKGSAGQFWNQVEDATGELNSVELRIPYLKQENSSRFGNAFRESLKVLGLPDFAHLEQVQRNLTPILLHGGIPAQDVSDVWDELIKALRQGRQDGSEVVIWWRANPGKLYQLNMPPKRFLQEAGRFAEDLIQRMLLVLYDPQLGDGASVERLSSLYRVPRVYIDRLLLVDPNVVKSVRDRQQIPSPTVVLDQYSGIGPQIRIPPLHYDAQEARWHVTSVVSQPTVASRRDEVDVPIEPAPRWVCELRSGSASLKYREFRGLGSLMAWLFVPDRTEYRFIDFLGTLENATHWILADRQSEILANTVEGAIRGERVEDFVFGGDWSDYSVFQMDLTNASSVRIVSQGREEVVPVVRGDERPTVVGDTLGDVRDVLGRPVYVNMPKLQFSRPPENLDSFVVFVEGPDGASTESTLSRLPNNLTSFDIFEGRRPTPGEYKVRVLALGSDISTTFIYLPDARLDGLGRVFAPDEEVSGALVVGTDSRFAIVVPPREWKAEVIVSAGGSWLRLLVKIRRADFSIQDRTSVPTFDSNVRYCTRAEFMDLRLGVSEMVLYLRLSEPCQFELRLNDTSGRSIPRSLMARPPLGRFDFPLSQIRDDVAAALAPSLDLYLHLYGVAPIRLLSIAEPPDSAVKSVRMRGADTGRSKYLEIEIAEALTSSILDVSVRNLQEPWRQTNVSRLVPQFGVYRYELEFPEEFGAGRHEVVLMTKSEFLSQVVGKIVCDLGTPLETAAYLGGLGNLGFDQVIRAIRIGQKPRLVTHDDFREGIDAVGRTLLEGSLESRSTRYAAALDYLLSEGNHEPLLEWLSQTLSDHSTRVAAEMMLLRMYPHFADTMSGVAEKLTEDLLVAVWNASPLLGTVVSRRLSAGQTEGSSSTREYWVGEPANFALVFATTIDTEGHLIEPSPANVHSQVGVLSSPFLRRALIEMHAGNSGSQQNTVLRLAEFDRQARDCYKSSEGYREAMPLAANLSTHPDSTRLKEPAKRLGRYANNLCALAYAMCDISQPYPQAEKAASLLVAEYKRSRLMVQVAVTRAVTGTG
jgi:hypothetical protein